MYIISWLIFGLAAQGQELIRSDVSAVDWFHLQDHSSSWFGRMQEMTKQLGQLAEKIESEYPGSRFGWASFTDKFVSNDDYKIISDLTGRTAAYEKLLDRYPTTWNPTMNDGDKPWPADDSALPDSVYAERAGKFIHEPKGCLEALFWASLYTNWSEDENTLRFMTQAVAGLSHFDGDGSFDDKWVSTFPYFDRDTRPAGQQVNIAAPNYNGVFMRYAPASLVRDVLKEKKIHLVVLYAIDMNRETPRKGWTELIGELGGDYTQSLFYLPAALNVVKSGLAGLENAVASTTVSTTPWPTTRPLTTTEYVRPPASGQWRIDWFHLQDNSDAWYGRMQSMTTQLTLLANEIDARYEGSRMGFGRYIDKYAAVTPYLNYIRETEDYHIVSNLTDKATALRRLSEAFPSTWNLNPLAVPWPNDDSNSLNSVYAVREGKLNNEIRGCLEPLIWVALHANWDPKQDFLMRLVTQAVAGLSHYHGDGSAEERKAHNGDNFVRTIFPVGEKSFWPSRLPSRGFGAKYATPDFTKEILSEADVHLIVLYGLDGNNETPREGWKILLTNLGIDHSTNLKYLGTSMEVFHEVIDLLPPVATTTSTMPTTTTTSTIPTTTTTSTEPTTITTSTIPTTTTSTEESTTTTSNKEATTSTSREKTSVAITESTMTTSVRPTIPKTETTGSLMTSMEGAEPEFTSSVAADLKSDGDVTEKECTERGCWNGKGMLLVVDEKPKILNLRIVS